MEVCHTSSTVSLSECGALGCVQGTLEFVLAAAETHGAWPGAVLGLQGQWGRAGSAQGRTR